MLLTNNKDTSQATTINTDDKEKPDTNLEVRNTLWYNIPEEMGSNLEHAVADCFRNIVAPRYNCQFKSYEPVQFLGYPVGGHYKGHNDGEHFNMETRQWERIMERDVSFLFYLNDQYGGGELEFYDLGLTIISWCYYVSKTFCNSLFKVFCHFLRDMIPQSITNF